MKDPDMAEVFPDPPMVAYKRPSNIKDKLVKARVPPPVSNRPKRNLPGMSKCKGCPICPFVKAGRKVKSTASNYTAEITQQLNCQTRNIVYCITCKKCSSQYIGESDRTLQDRFSEHRGYVTNHHLNKATGHHFNLPGHQVSDMEITIIEKIYNPDGRFRRSRETMWIQEFNTKYKGMNRRT